MVLKRVLTRNMHIMNYGTIVNKLDLCYSKCIYKFQKLSSLARCAGLNCTGYQMEKCGGSTSS